MKIHVVYEGGDLFDNGEPWNAWQRVGLCIEDKVFWLALSGPAGGYQDFVKWEGIARRIAVAVIEQEGEEE